MGQKDIAEKTLEAYNDVFADIVNVLIFNGKRTIKEKDLEDETPRSCMKIDGKLHEQERDVAKFWNNNNIRIALYGLENQTKPDSDMSLRICSYDGAAYKEQLLNDERKERYPVVTLVLYFGTKHWKQPRTLHERLIISEELKPFVSDHKANIFEISFLTNEQVNLFKSDFKIVADYFVQLRTKKDYVPPNHVIKHVTEVLRLLRILTGDERFTPDTKLITKKGKPVTMCEVLDRIENRGIEKGIEKGKVLTLAELVKKGLLTIQQAAKEMNVTVSKFKALTKEFATN